MNNFLSWIAIFAFCALPFDASQSPNNTGLSNKIRKVVIDAGHGGKDSGSLGKSSQEKNIALSIALKVGGYITSYLPDVKVIYTRKDDTFYTLYERAQKANDHDADVFISIHCNSAPPVKKHINGTETYVMGLHTAEENLAVAKRENEVILMEDNYKKNYAGFDPNSSEGHIMLSMYQNAYLSQSILLAEKIENQFVNRVGRPSRGVKQAGFMVLKSTNMPSVLIETGFLSNSTEEAYLRSDKGQTYLASAIYRAFKEYKYAMEGNTAAIKDDLPAVAEPETPTNTGSSIVFKVQLASSSAPLDTYAGRWTAAKGVQQEKIDGVYKYVIGNYTKMEEAVNQQSYVRKNGFADAFIVAYQGGKRIPLATAKQILGIP